MAKSDQGYNWFINKAWMRDKGVIYTGAPLVLACLLHVKKDRTPEQEEELKEIMNVYATGKRKSPSRNKKNKK